jgi:hypothetical protein
MLAALAWFDSTESSLKNAIVFSELLPCLVAGA